MRNIEELDIVKAKMPFNSLKINLPIMSVLSARGRDSLSEKQLEALSEVSRLNVYSVPGRLKNEELIALCKDTEILGITRRAAIDIDKNIISAMPYLKGIAIYASGYDWIDLDTLRDKRIALAVLPDYSTQTVSEHTWGMILTMSRRLHLSDRVAAEELPSSISLRGFELAGKTLGLIGFGRIGKAIARISKAFLMNVLYHDKKKINSDLGEYAAFGKVLSSSDIVVLACSYDRGFPPLIDSHAIETIKPGSYLINPVRKALVDHDCILQAISDKRLAGYAVDDCVYTKEQLAKVEAGRIFQTRHTAWYSNEAIKRGTQCWVDNLIGLARKQNINRVI